MKRRVSFKIKHIFVAVNVLLALAIALLLWNKYYSTGIEFEVNYGEKPQELLNIMQKHFKHQGEKEVSIVYIFNQLPALNDIETIKKLFKKYKNNVNYYVFFHKKFRLSTDPEFPYKFLTNIRLRGKIKSNILKDNYFILLKNQEIKHFDFSMKIIETNFLIEKYVHPEKSYRDFAISEKRLKNRLILELKKGNKELLNLSEDDFENFENFTGYNKIYFAVSGCTTCELKKLIRQMKIQKIIDNTESLVIFPIQAQSSELMEIVEKENVQLPIYIDYNDQFNLLSIITSKKTELIVINTKDMEDVK